MESEVSGADPLLTAVKQENPDDNSNKQMMDMSDSTPGMSSAEGDSTESPSTETTEPSANTQCVWCLNVLGPVDKPQLLECLHAACSQCVEGKLTDSLQSDAGVTPYTVICNACTMPSQKGFIIDNQFILEATSDDSAMTPDDMTEVKCSSCNDDAVASSWCVECAEFICFNCVQAHQRLKITKDHTIKDKEAAGLDKLAQASENVAGGRSVSCFLHPKECLTLFCETCDRLTCRDCQLSDHRDHKYKFSHEIAEETRFIIHDLLGEVSYKRVLLSSAMKVIDDRQNLISEKRKSLRQEITHMVVKLTNTINTRGKQLVLRLNEVCDAKQKTLSEKKAALEQLSQHTDHCINFVNGAIDKSTDFAVLFSKRQVTNHLQKIKCRRADIPNPEIPVRIHLALEKVPDLIKVVQSIGAIVVDGKVYPPGSSQQPVGTPNASGGAMQPPQTPPPMQTQYRPPQPQPPNQQQMLYNHHGMHHSGAQPVQAGQGLPGGPSPTGAQRLPLNNLLRPSLLRLPRQINTVRHQQVSSSTHPHNIDISLRGLLHQPVQNQGPPLYPVMRCVTTGPRIYRSPSQPLPPQYTAANYGMSAQQGQVQVQAQQTRYIPSPQGMHQVHQQQSHQTQQNLQPLQNQQQQMNQQQNHQTQQTHQPLPNHQQQNHQPLQNHQQQQNHQLMQNHQQQQNHHQQQNHQQLQNHQQQQNHQLQPNQQQRLISQQPPSDNPTMRQMLNAQQGYQNQLNQYGQQAALPKAMPNPKWHIPQHADVHINMDRAGYNNLTSGNEGSQVRDDNFKITIKQHSHKSGSTVTSTNPKTPSPNSSNPSYKDDTDHIDMVCQDSVNDLMATIAKLDSNGVQVLPEGVKGPKGDTPLVDSSTDEAPALTTSIREETKEDPNEDWCAVCMDGGELMCCDKCPKVFHSNCHIPSLEALPDDTETWQCMLCVNFADIPPDKNSEKVGVLSERERKILERITLEMYCQYEHSLYFRELVSPENIEYYSKIEHPIALCNIKEKLDPKNVNYYTHMALYISDVKLMFRNAYKYNDLDSIVYKHATILEEFFDRELDKYLPCHARNDNGDDVAFPPAKKARLLSD